MRVEMVGSQWWFGEGVHGKNAYFLGFRLRWGFFGRDFWGKRVGFLGGFLSASGELSSPAIPRLRGGSCTREKKG